MVPSHNFEDVPPGEDGTLACNLDKITDSLGAENAQTRVPSRKAFRRSDTQRRQMYSMVAGGLGVRS